MRLLLIPLLWAVSSCTISKDFLVETNPPGGQILDEISGQMLDSPARIERTFELGDTYPKSDNRFITCYKLQGVSAHWGHNKSANLFGEPIEVCSNDFEPTVQLTNLELLLASSPSIEPASEPTGPIEKQEPSTPMSSDAKAMIAYSAGCALVGLFTNFTGTSDCIASAPSHVYGTPKPKRKSDSVIRSSVYERDRQKEEEKVKEERPRRNRCMDGSYVYGTCQQAPDGTYVGGRPQLAPDGTYVGGRPRLAPDRTYVGSDSGDITLCPDGSYVGGTRCMLAPDRTYIGAD